jgi:hypothetical protein
VPAAAAAAGHQHVLAFLQEELDWDWHHATPAAAARWGHFSLLKWLHEQDCEWHDDSICSDAVHCGTAMRGHMHVLEYMQQQGRLPDAQGLPSALRAAGAQDRLAVAQWLRQHGAAWPGRAYGWIFHRGAAVGQAGRLHISPYRQGTCLQHTCTHTTEVIACVCVCVCNATVGKQQLTDGCRRKLQACQHVSLPLMCDSTIAGASLDTQLLSKTVKCCNHTSAGRC